MSWNAKAAKLAENHVVWSSFAVCAAFAFLFVVRLSAQTLMNIPQYTVDPSWPKPLPNHWIVGAVVGVAVDTHDHIWITHRPSTLQPNETRSFWKAAPVLPRQARLLYQRSRGMARPAFCIRPSTTGMNFSDE